MKICEIFFSIQGEGIYIGKPCCFVRLSGCNLRCEWCDTKFAWDNENATEMSINTILDEIKKYNCKTIMITGGEPLLQAKIYLLIDELIDSKYEVILETNGSISIDRVRQEVSISLDIKCPSSSENGSNNYQNLEFLKKTDLIKFVVSNKKDFDFAIKKIIEYEMYNRCDNIYFSAVTSELKLSELSEYILNLYETKHSHRNNLMITLEKIRMQIQLHKVIWNPDERGR